MNLRTILIIAFFLNIGYCIGQNQYTEIDQLGYPNGIYESKESFINKQPTTQCELFVKRISLIGENDTIVRRCFFINKRTNKKEKKAFAIVQNGYVYFRTDAILKNKNKDDKALTPDSKKSFVLVLIGGDNYLYAEAGLINLRKSTASFAASNAVGGIPGNELGEHIEKSGPPTTNYGKGIVWDVKNNEFNIFQDCYDFNEFISTHSVQKLECNKAQIEFKEIREIMNIIK